jgi:hypothetical protein
MRLHPLGHLPPVRDHPPGRAMRMPAARDLRARVRTHARQEAHMIRKLKSGEYRLYSIKKDAQTGRRRNLGTFKSLEAAKQHEREVQYFKRHG